jgi:hypothetical protein
MEKLYHSPSINHDHSLTVRNLFQYTNKSYGKLYHSHNKSYGKTVSMIVQ